MTSRIQNRETAALLLCQANFVGVQLLSYAHAFFGFEYLRLGGNSVISRFLYLGFYACKISNTRPIQSRRLTLSPKPSVLTFQICVDESANI